MATKRTVKKSKVITCHNCTFYNINAECHINDTCEVIHRFTWRVWTLCVRGNRKTVPSKCLRRHKCVWEDDERTPGDLFLSVFNPHLSTNSLVLCGSWSGHKNEQVLLETFGEKDVDLKIIPPKTTKYAQPLDMYYSGNIKYMPRE